jgi:parallel beta-helix repeat protein
MLFSVSRGLFTCIILLLLIGVGNTDAKCPANVKRYYIKEDMDLQGRVWDLPANSVLEFKGGCLSNGAIKGKDIKIKGNVRYHHVNFNHSCSIKNISDSFFDIADEENLVDLFSLLNDREQQTLEVAKNYRLSKATQEGHTYLSICSNTHLKFKGHITLADSEVGTYYLLMGFQKDHIKISGGGTFTGDVEQNKAKGEFGMGLTFIGCNDVEICDITVEKMFGDGIYLGGAAGNKVNRNIFIHDCVIDYNRRTGIAVCMCDGVRIINNTITNTAQINGTPTKSPIDIEPNAKVYANNIYIGRNTITNNAYNVILMNSGPGDDVRSYNVVVEDINTCDIGFSSVGSLVIRRFNNPKGKIHTSHLGRVNVKVIDSNFKSISGICDSLSLTNCKVDGYSAAESKVVMINNSRISQVDSNFWKKKSFARESYSIKNSTIEGEYVKAKNYK